MRKSGIFVILSVVLSLGVVTATLRGDSMDWFYKKGAYTGWKYVVIHHSATDQGSARAFDRFHTSQGYGGLAYHFVIGNGRGTGDGVVETGARWHDQRTGTHVSVNSWDHNIYGIGICLVGNFEKSAPTKKQWEALVGLTADLVAKHGISVDAIMGHHDVPFDNDPKKRETTSCPGNKFPMEELKRAVTKQLKAAQAAQSDAPDGGK
jgi:N-acetylmuramoyl-L-alanine amidase